MTQTPHCSGRALNGVVAAVLVVSAGFKWAAPGPLAASPVTDLVPAGLFDLAS